MFNESRWFWNYLLLNYNNKKWNFLNFKIVLKPRREKGDYMKKASIIVLAIIILIAIVIGIMYVIDTTRMLKNKEAIFSTWGYTVNEPKEIKNGSKDIPKEDKIIFNDSM